MDTTKFEYFALAQESPYFEFSSMTREEAEALAEEAYFDQLENEEDELPW